MRRALSAAVLLAATLAGLPLASAPPARAAAERPDAQPAPLRVRAPQPAAPQGQAEPPAPKATIVATMALAPAAAPAEDPAPAQPPAHPAGRRPAPRRAPPPDADTLRLRGEDHPGYGRVIVPMRNRGGDTVTVDGDRLVIGYPAVRQAIAPAKLPRNVAAITPGLQETVITAAAGSRLRTQAGVSALIVDILDPPPAVPGATASAAPGATPPAPAAQGAVAALRPAAAPVIAAALAPAAAPPTPLPATPLPAAPASPAALTPAEEAILAPQDIPIVPIENAVQPTILLRTDATVGLAVFRDGDDMLLVLDANLPFDTARIALDPVFGRTVITRMQDATVLRIKLPPPASLRPAHGPRGWTITAIPAPDPVIGIAPRLVDGPAGASHMQLPTASPSRSVTVLEPGSGDHILVGTQGSSGQGMANQRELVQFTLLPTVQGVAVAVHSDDIALQRETDGFSLLAGRRSGGAILSSMEPAAPLPPGATQLPRLFDFPDLPAPQLAARLEGRIAAAADAPAQARAEPRQRVAEAMIPLTMGVEAQGVLALAASANPELKDQPAFIALDAIAALVGYRPEAAQDLLDPRLADPHLQGAAEVRLWRGLLLAEQNEASPQAARDIAATIPLLLSYPAPLRDRFLPRAVQTLALGGQPAAARAVLDKRPDDPALELARGMLHEVAGEPDAALRSYTALIGQDDRLARYKAMVRSAQLRLARGAIGPKEAADALDAALYAWREPADELALRVRMSDLRRQAGQWREAVALLREARAAFPDARTRIDSELAGIFSELFEGDAAARMPAADFVALYDENADLLRQSSLSEVASNALVNRLIALDLPGRADPVLTQMIAQSRDPARRALLGARLASVRLGIDDGAGALAALADTAPRQASVPSGPAGDGQPAPLSDELIQTRQILYARAEAQRGHADTAIAMLAALNSADADDLRANLCSSRKDWPGAVAALNDLAAKLLPPAGAALSISQQAIVMRLASAATLAGDGATIERLRATRADAMAKGPSAAAFQVITAAPITGVGDLSRASQELGLARGLPSALARAPRPTYAQLNAPQPARAQP
jgi:hypothetical protein